jgi:hypothetical protein
MSNDGVEPDAVEFELKMLQKYILLTSKELTPFKFKIGDTLKIRVEKIKCV